jgi:hypothetical protein
VTLNKTCRRETYDIGKRAAESNAQAQAAQAEALLQGLNVFTHLEPTAHRWDVSQIMSQLDNGQRLTSRMTTMKTMSLTSEMEMRNPHHQIPQYLARNLQPISQWASRNDL